MFICIYKNVKHNVGRWIFAVVALVSVYGFRDQTGPRSPRMVITLRHNQPILPTGFEGDFPLTLGLLCDVLPFL